MDNKEYGQSIFVGFLIFVFVCALTILLNWCGHRRDRNDYQAQNSPVSIVRFENFRMC